MGDVSTMFSGLVRVADDVPHEWALPPLLAGGDGLSVVRND